MPDFDAATLAREAIQRFCEEIDRLGEHARLTEPDVQEAANAAIAAVVQTDQASSVPRDLMPVYVLLASAPGAGSESGQFVEVETPSGRGVRVPSGSYAPSIEGPVYWRIGPFYVLREAPTGEMLPPEGIGPEARKLGDALNRLIARHEEEGHRGHPCRHERVNVIAYLGHRVGIRDETSMGLLTDRLRDYERLHDERGGHDHGEE